MPTTLTCPIVGSHFRPPAKQLLTVLPVGSALVLRPEPDNPYDENAIQVLVSVASTYPVAKWAVLATALAGTGFEPQDLIDREAIEGPLQLGYIPKSGTKTAAGGPGNIEVLQAMAPPGTAYQARLVLSSKGIPLVRIIFPSPDTNPQAQE